MNRDRNKEFALSSNKYLNKTIISRSFKNIKLCFIVSTLWSLEVVGDWLLANVKSPTTSNDQKVQKSTNGQELPTTINTKYLQL
ncbi:hypothetical protein BpHYR1_008899, partial [Brachionus plicatilis]